jgi:hypothetical protein
VFSVRYGLYLCVLCGSENKQRLFPYTVLTILSILLHSCHTAAVWISSVFYISSCFKLIRNFKLTYVLISCLTITDVIVVLSRDNTTPIINRAMRGIIFLRWQQTAQFTHADYSRTDVIQPPGRHAQSLRLKKWFGSSCSEVSFFITIM